MQEPPPESDSVFKTAICVELGMGFLALFLGWLLDVDVRQWLPRLSLENAWPILRAVLWGLAAALPMLLAIELIERIDWQPFHELRSLDQLPVIAALLRLRPAELIAISIAAGVGEELLLRGWLMGWIIGPPATADWTAIAIGLTASSIAFGLMHPVTPTYAIIATLIGFYLGGLVLWTGNLLVAITAHAAYDAAHLLVARQEHLRESKRIREREGDNDEVDADDV